MKSDKTFIKIKDTIYNVRPREILVDNKWISTTEFIDYLSQNSKWDELSELAQLGANEIQEREKIS
jgi:hypothetical protein